jgi:hypothetical protein
MEPTKRFQISLEPLGVADVLHSAAERLVEEEVRLDLEDQRSPR